MKSPSFQFYPSDWRSDNGVQSLNYFERGVWFEMLCLMHESEQRGKLLLNGKAMPEEALARLLSLDRQVLSKTLATLLDFGVCSREDNGTLFSRRMVKDEAERQANAERQRRFYEKKKPNGEPNGDLTGIQQKPNTPSSSSFKKDKPKGLPKKASRIPEDFQVTDKMLDWALSNAPNVAVERELAKFKNYYAAASGKNAVGLDWAAKWRTWMSNAQTWWEEKNPPPVEVPAAISEQAAAYLAAEAEWRNSLARPGVANGR